MKTIRNQTGWLVDVEDDGRRISFDLDAGHCPADKCPCEHDRPIRVTFDKAELLALLGGGK